MNTTKHFETLGTVDSWTFNKGWFIYCSYMEQLALIPYVITRPK